MIDSFNLGYIVTRTYDFVAAIHVDPALVSLWVQVVLHDVALVGMVVSFVLLVLVVYAHIKLLVTEHEGFHKLEHEAHHHAHTGPEGESDESGENDRWSRIMALSVSPVESDWRRAILEADIMLGDALNEKGFVGVTVADQLRQANPFQLTTLEAAWSAHKMRNQVAHQGEALALSEREVRATVDQYKRVFEELGAL